MVTAALFFQYFWGWNWLAKKAPHLRSLGLAIIQGLAAGPDIAAVSAFGAAIDFMEGMGAAFRTGLACTREGVLNVSWHRNSRGAFHGRFCREVLVFVGGAFLGSLALQSGEGNLIAISIKEAALDEDLLEGVANGGNFGLVVKRDVVAIVAMVGARADGALIPDNFAHVLESTSKRRPRAPQEG